jgi:predicted transcriptional regulator
MPGHLIELGGGRPLLDIASYARRGPARRDRLSSSELELIARTVDRTPEVMVKVLTRGGQDLSAVRRHLSYLNRGGELELETDEGEQIRGKGIEKDFLEDWDLDLEEHRRRGDVAPRRDRQPPKLVHKILFSMPPETPPKKVLEAVKNFAREEFGGKHRYAMVLHTDEPHPHIHVVVKAMSERGERLNIRKPMLREWRSEFARHLRSLGVPANATERSVRGQSRSSKRDGIYWAAKRGKSRLVRERTEEVAAEVRRGGLRVESGKAKLLNTREAVRGGWNAVSDLLLNEGRLDLAQLVGGFAKWMSSPETDRERIAKGLESRTRSSSVDRLVPPIR